VLRDLLRSTGQRVPESVLPALGLVLASDL
jgi:hypothetical protein